MTKEVLVSISGLQFGNSDDEAIELITQGEYYYRGGKHYVRYEEVTEEAGQQNTCVQCMLKLSPQRVELNKQGESNTQLCFETGKSNLSVYHTPYGELMLGITTTSIELSVENNRILATLVYSLNMNYEHVSDCTLTIGVQERTV